MKSRLYRLSRLLVGVLYSRAVPAPASAQYSSEYTGVVFVAFLPDPLGHATASPSTHPSQLYSNGCTGVVFPQAPL